MKKRLDNLENLCYNKICDSPTCRNWQTRQTQNLLQVTVCGFKSHCRHQNGNETARVTTGGFLRPVAIPYVNICREIAAICNREKKDRKKAHVTNVTQVFFSLLESRSRSLKAGVPRGIRTPDLLVRSQSLYPAELWAHVRQFTLQPYLTTLFIIAHLVEIVNKISSIF